MSIKQSNIIQFSQEDNQLSITQKMVKATYATKPEWRNQWIEKLMANKPTEDQFSMHLALARLNLLTKQDSAKVHYSEAIKIHQDPVVIDEYLSIKGNDNVVYLSDLKR